MTSERQETENRDEFGYSESDIVKHHGNPVWEAIWSTIKRWDISRKNDGLYSSATGTDVQVIFDAVAAALRATPRAVPDETRTFGAGTIPRFVDVVCAGPPGPSAGRFVECDDEAGKSVSAGEWQERPDGLWALRIYLNPSPAAGHAVPDETLEAVAFTASAGTCRRCKSRVRMGGPAPDSCTNCAAPAESHPPRAVPASGERQAVEPLCERLSRAALNQRDTGQHHAADDLDAACAVIRALASPAVAPDETRVKVWCETCLGRGQYVGAVIGADRRYADCKDCGGVGYVTAALGRPS